MGGGVLRTTTIFFDRLETVPFSVFSLGRETWSTRAMLIQNTEAYRLEYCSDCRLAQISLRKCAVKHVLHCDGSLKGLARLPYPGFEQKSSATIYCLLQLSLVFKFCDVKHQYQATWELCVEPLWYVRSHIPLPSSWIYATYSLKNKFKALNNLLNNAEYIITS